MSIIFKRNEDRAVIGHYELPLRLNWQVFDLLDWMMPANVRRIPGKYECI